MLKKILNYLGSSKKSTRFYNDEYAVDFTNIDSLFSHSPVNKAYKNNVIVHRCVDLISGSAAHIPLLLYINGKRLNNHYLSKILKHPNHLNAGAVFFEKVIANKLLFGNSYILASISKQCKLSEIFVLPPSSVEVALEHNAIVGYKYNSNQSKKFFPLNQVTGASQILHLKNYNPYSDIYGISNLDAASLAIELHNHAIMWNNALLKNGARPTGALIMKDSEYLSEEQFTRLKSQLNEQYSGAVNSGKPLLLEGGLDWREMSISPKDMDFMESKASAAREIALAFGVPPQLLGIAGDNTYSNMQEARLALWEETIIPILDNLTDSLSGWFSKMLSEDIRIDFDRDAISALSDKRENVWAKISAANFMTINEKRALVGLPPLKDGDAM